MMCTVIAAAAVSMAVALWFAARPYVVYLAVFAGPVNETVDYSFAVEIERLGSRVLTLRLTPRQDALIRRAFLVPEISKREAQP